MAGSRKASLADDLERVLPARPEAKHGEMVVERGGSAHAEALHDREAGAVNDGKILIGEPLANRPRRLEIHGRDGFDGRDAAAQSLPELLGGTRVQPVPQQDPRFDENVS